MTAAITEPEVRQWTYVLRNGVMRHVALSSAGYGWSWLNAQKRWVLRESLIIDDKRAHVSVHVLEQFGPGYPQDGKKYECCHRDDNRSNNDISNLYWGTRAQNVDDAYRNGLLDRNKFAHIDLDAAVEMYRQGAPVHRVAQHFGTSSVWMQVRLRARIKLRTRADYDHHPLSLELRERIHEAYLSGQYTRRQLGPAFGVTYNQIRNLTKHIMTTRTPKTSDDTPGDVDAV